MTSVFRYVVNIVNKNVVNGAGKPVQADGGERSEAQLNEISEFLATQQLATVHRDVFEGRSPRFGWTRVFGGHLLAQSLAAAQKTVQPDRFVHSLQAYFHSPAAVTSPVSYHVSRLHDGRSFNSRRVEARQQGRLILSMNASFHLDEGGPSRHEAMPLGVPHPDTLPNPAAFLARHWALAAETTRDLWNQPSPFDIRPVVLGHYVDRTPRSAVQQVWMRLKQPLQVDRVRAAAILAYMSDLTLLGVTTFAHGGAITDPGVQSSSISHAMWFHRPATLEGWLLYVQDSPTSQNGLGLARGSLYAADGVLVASVAQEGLVRFGSAP